MNEAGRWKCSLGWMAIHIATTTSLIIHDHLRQGTRKKRTSTFSYRRIVSDSRVWENIFKNCLSTPMMRPSDDIVFTIIKFNQMWIYYKLSLIFIFLGTHKRFTWICSGPWCSRITMQTRCRRFTWYFLTIWSMYQRMNMTGGRQYYSTSTSLVYISSHQIA
jgi:hypothetical protein